VPRLSSPGCGRPAGLGSVRPPSPARPASATSGRPARRRATRVAEQEVAHPLASRSLKRTVCHQGLPTESPLRRSCVLGSRPARGRMRQPILLREAWHREPNLPRSRVRTPQTATETVSAQTSSNSPRKTPSPDAAASAVIGPLSLLPGGISSRGRFYEFGLV
jgi:hypothetical protein